MYIQTGDGVINEISRDDLFANESIQYNLYKYHSKSHIFDALKEYANSKMPLESSLLEIVFNKDMYTNDEWKAYEEVREVTPFLEMGKIKCSLLKSSNSKEHFVLIDIFFLHFIPQNVY
jgi:hypothetical protein